MPPRSPEARRADLRRTRHDLERHKPNDRAEPIARRTTTAALAVRRSRVPAGSAGIHLHQHARRRPLSRRADTARPSTICNRWLGLNSAQIRRPDPGHMAFVALARRPGLGRRDAGSPQTLDRLRGSHEPEALGQDDDESEAFSDEANSLIGGIEPPIVEVGRFLGLTRGAEVNKFAAMSRRDGRSILAGSVGRGHDRLWDRSTGQMIQSFGGSWGEREVVAFLTRWPSGSLPATRPARSIRRWDLDSGKLDSRVLVAISRGSSTSPISPAAAWVIPAAAGRSLARWLDSAGAGSGTSGPVTESASLKGARPWSSSLAVSPDGHKVLTGGNDGNADPLGRAQGGK